MPRTYTVKKGDTLWGISKNYGLTVDELKSLNDLETNTIQPGQELVVEKAQSESDKTAIQGENKTSLDKMVSFVKKVNPSFNSNIAKYFLEISKVYDIRGDIAFCQSIHETDFFRFTGVVKEEQNNFAGIGATSSSNPGHSFSTAEEGVRAQIQHLYAYATTNPLPKDEKLADPRFEKVNRGSAPNLEDLAGKWAYPGYNKNKFDSLEEAYRNGDTYGQKILSLYKSMLEDEGSMSEEKRDFKQYTIEEFDRFIKKYPSIKRTINHIQIHHTWKPRKTDYKGESTIYSMWHYHTKTRGWQDIGQHFSIAPDGTIWDGRPLEIIPAGITGHNKGGIMFEIIGNFDKGEEKLEGEQLEAVIVAVRACMERFKLEKDDIVFHREYASKSCPGTGISKEWFLEQISKKDTKPEPKDGYPGETDEWKKEGVDWLYKEGFLTGDDWKKKINEPMPLWAQALVLKRLFEKFNSK